MTTAAALAVFTLLVCVCAQGALVLRAAYPSARLAGAVLYARGNDKCGLNWDSGIRMSQSGDVWSVSLDCTGDVISPSSPFEFKVLISDQTWSIGANYKVASVGGGNQQVTFYPHFRTTAGRYQYIRRVSSPQLGNTRDLVVYTPPSYDENTLKIYDKVLIMHDGQNVFNTSTAFGRVAWNAHTTVNSLVNSGGMDEIIIVAVDNTPGRIEELTYSRDSNTGGGKGDVYLDFIEETVIPLISSRFPRVKPVREQLGILGSSLGGLISCYALWTRSDVYGKAGCMSSSFWWNNQDFNRVILARPAPDNVAIYLDSGDAGPSRDGVAETNTVRDSLVRLGYTLNSDLFYYLDRGGQHSEIYWQRRFNQPMIKLYPPSPLRPASL